MAAGAAAFGHEKGEEEELAKAHQRDERNRSLQRQSALDYFKDSSYEHPKADTADETGEKTAERTLPRGAVSCSMF